MSKENFQLNRSNIKKQQIKWYLESIFSWNLIDVYMFPDLSVQLNLVIDKEIIFLQLQKDNILELINFHNAYCIQWKYLFSYEDVIKKLQDGHRCYIAQGNEEIVGFIWIAFNEVYSSDLNCIFKIENNCSVLYNAFVKPDFRGRNVLPGLKKFAFMELHKEGYEKCFDYVLSSNKSMKISNTKFKPFVIGRILYGYFFGFYFLFPFFRSHEGLSISYVYKPSYRWRNLFKKLNWFKIRS